MKVRPKKLADPNDPLVKRAPQSFTPAPVPLQNDVKNNSDQSSCIQDPLPSETESVDVSDDARDEQPDGEKRPMTCVRRATREETLAVFGKGLIMPGRKPVPRAQFRSTTGADDVVDENDEVHPEDSDAETSATGVHKTTTPDGSGN